MKALKLFKMQDLGSLTRYCFLLVLLLSAISGAQAQGIQSCEDVLNNFHLSLTNPPLIEPILEAAHKNGDVPFQVKKVMPLEKVVQFLRQLILQSGRVDTTRKRSEYKHYLTRDQAEEILRKLQADFPPEFDINGRLIKGMASRDFRVKANNEEVTAALGLELAESLTPLLNTLSYPDVFGQHESYLRQEIEKHTGDREKTKRIITNIKALHERVMAETIRLGPHIYTDTASTRKFSFSAPLSERSIEMSAADFGITVNPKKLGKIKELVNSDMLQHENGVYNDLVEALHKKGDKRRRARAFLDDLLLRHSNEGVIRYRKYRDGPADVPFDGVPAPGSGLPSKNAVIQDASFCNGIVWLELKMKDTHGEDELNTVVDKPRFPVLDSTLPIWKDRNRFLDPSIFRQTGEMLKQEIRDTILRKEVLSAELAQWDEKSEAEVNALLDFVRSLHMQGFSFEPVGRTVYLRDSYDINLVDNEGRVYNVQLTRDPKVWELDRVTGKKVQALPWFDLRHRRWFQYNPLSGGFEHLDLQAGYVSHFLYPDKVDVVYERFEGSWRQVEADLVQVEVNELKVPLEIMNFSPENLQRIPGLDLILNARLQMVRGTQALNKNREKHHLSPFGVDVGKRSASRNDVGGGIFLLVHPQGKNKGVKTKELVRRLFNYHPETGYWVDWSSDGRYIYHPLQGVYHIVGNFDGLKRPKVETVYFKNLSGIR